MLKIKETRMKSNRSKPSHCSLENDNNMPSLSYYTCQSNLIQEGASNYLFILVKQ